jgi:hypothetical protein
MVCLAAILVLCARADQLQDMMLARFERENVPTPAPVAVIVQQKEAVVQPTRPLKAPEIRHKIFAKSIPHLAVCSPVINNTHGLRFSTRIYNASSALTGMRVVDLKGQALGTSHNRGLVLKKSKKSLRLEFALADMRRYHNKMGALSHSLKLQTQGYPGAHRRRVYAGEHPRQFYVAVTGLKGGVSNYSCMLGNVPTELAFESSKGILSVEITPAAAATRMAFQPPFVYVCTVDIASLAKGPWCLGGVSRL